jgi:fumarate hydratase class II
MCYNTHSMGENSYQKSFHIEVDSIGQVNVPSNKYWGAQTQRALQQTQICYVTFKDNA